MIHKELRFTALVIRFIIPYYTLRKFRIANSLLCFIKGRHSRKMRYEQIYISRPNGSKLRLCVYSPLTLKKNVPGLLWIHGGGIAIGTPEQEVGFIRRFIDSSGCVVVSPDYALSVDAPYPAALEDCYLSLLWLKKHSKDYGIRSDQIFVGGDSAGGGLTAAVCMYARDKGEVSIAFQMPLYPMMDDRMITQSMKDNNAPVWNEASNKAAWKLYLGNRFETSDIPIYAAPAREENVKDLPPACSFVGSVDPFLDETVNYIEKLKDAGIPTQFKVFDGCFHAFDIICRNTNVRREAITFLMNAFKYAVEHYTKSQPDD